MGEAIRCRGTKVYNLFVSKDPLNAAIYYASAGTAEIFECKPQENHTSPALSGGEPYGAQFDQHGRIHIADCAHAVWTIIAFGDDGTIFFTDSGPVGETTLEKPRGSIFSICTIPSGGQILRPLVLECLAHPSGITASPADPKILFVAEMMQNRIFAGGLGPSCIACDGHGKLYVDHYDFAGSNNNQGKVSVLPSDGVLQYTLDVPGTEITGICLRYEERNLAVSN